MQTHLSPEEKKLIGYKAESSLDENYAGHSYAKEILMTLFSNKGACIGLVCILIIVGFAIFAPMVSPYTYKEVHSETTNLPMRIPGLENLRRHPQGRGRLRQQGREGSIPLFRHRRAGP